MNQFGTIQGGGGGFRMPPIDQLSGKFAKNVRMVGPIILGIFLFLFAISSYYKVEPFEQAVVLRFGKLAGIRDPGPNFRIPLVDTIYKVPTERQLKEEFGFRTLAAGQRSSYAKEGYSNESLMLTGDLNIADVEWVVQYRIDDPYRFLFHVRQVQETVRQVAEAEMRGAVGDRGFDQVIKSKRSEIEVEVEARMQEILDSYEAGVNIKLVQLQDVHPPNPVKDSFEEVNRALQEKERLINQALQERNKVIFRVEGEAKQRVAVAEGLKVERINRAMGDASRFEAFLAEYRKAPDVTRRRLYLEEMAKILPRSERVLIVDEDVEGMLPILDLSGTANRSVKAAAGGAQ